MKRPIKTEDFLEFKAFSMLKQSPNKERFGFICSTMNQKENGFDRVIYISDGKSFKQMTSLKKESSFVWEDDAHILFGAKRFKHEEEQTNTTYIYRLPLHGGEARVAYEIPLAISQFWVLEDDRLLISASYDINHPNYYTYSQSKREELEKKKKDDHYFQELTQIPYWFNGSQYIDKKRTRLFVFDTTNNELTPITGPSFDVGHVVVNKEKTKIYYTGNTYKTKRPTRDRLYVMDTKDFEVTPLLSTNKYRITNFVEISSGLYVFASDSKSLGINQNPNLYKLIEPNQLELINDNIDFGNSIGSDVRLGFTSSLHIEDDYFIYNTTIDGHSELVKFDGHQNEVIFNKEGSVDGFTQVNNQLIVMGLFNQKLQEFYDQELNPLSTFNSILDNKQVFKPEKLTFQSHGDEISGWVIMPSETTDKAILNIHGGPKTAYGEVYYHEMQVWANLGYAVMFCNPHGSSGKGDSFSDIRGKYGTIDYDDIMTFTDAVLEKYPNLNPDKVAVTGGSYGGFMTNWIIGHTDRFICAITQRSISNWLSFYGVSDIGYYFTPDQNAAEIYTKAGQEKLWEKSPLKYAANFSTPTLVVHSTDDYRCPIDQGYQLFTALLDRRVEAKMLILNGENHDLSRSGKPNSRLKRLNEMVEWFEKYNK